MILRQKSNKMQSIGFHKRSPPKMFSCSYPKFQEQLLHREWGRYFFKDTATCTKAWKNPAPYFFLIAFMLNFIDGLETFLRLRKVSAQTSSTDLTRAQVYRHITKTRTQKWETFLSKPKADNLYPINNRNTKFRQKNPSS